MFTIRENLESIEWIFREAEKSLSGWEFDFLVDIKGKLDTGFNLTEKQEDKLNELFDKHIVLGN